MLHCGNDTTRLTRRQHGGNGGGGGGGCCGRRGVAVTVGGPRHVNGWVEGGGGSKGRVDDGWVRQVAVVLHHLVHPFHGDGGGHVDAARGGHLHGWAQRVQHLAVVVRLRLHCLKHNRRW